MKKLLILILIIFSFLNIANNSYAQSATEAAKTIEVSYDLPYPGILPDSPLYFLKALRDNVIGFFITDNLKKAEYDLLMADKRLTSSVALANKKNYQLAITTLSKSGNYFDKAIQLTIAAKKEGKDTKVILDNLWKASQKHQVVIYIMAKDAKKDVKYSIEFLQLRSKSFQDTVELVKSQ